MSQDNMKNENGGTIQFSLDKTKHVNLKKPAKTVGKPLTEEAEQAQEVLSQEREELEMLNNQTPPTEFEDVFSDKEKAEDEVIHTQGIVGIEEVFEQKAAMINENFHDGGEEDVPEHNPKLKKAAIIIGIVSGAIILAAIAIGVIILI